MFCNTILTIMRTTSSSSTMRGDGAPATDSVGGMITVAYCSTTSSARDLMAATRTGRLTDVVRPRERHRLKGSAALRMKTGRGDPTGTTNRRQYPQGPPVLL
jgi:hypothetical protein